MNSIIFYFFSENNRFQITQQHPMVSNIWFGIPESTLSVNNYISVVAIRPSPPKHFKTIQN